MNSSDIPRHPPTSTLRWFAAIWLGWFLALAGWEWVGSENGWVALALAAAAVSVGVFGIVWPQRIRLLFVGAMILAFPAGWVVSRVLMGAVYYGVFTPLAVVFRMIGRDVLHRRSRPRDSYWMPKEQPADISSYFHQS